MDLNKQIIAIAGTARAGKDTAADIIRSRTGCYIDHWARKLKELAATIETTYPEYPDIKGLKWLCYRMSGIAGTKLPFWDGSDATKRVPCVSLGAGARNVLDKDIWINSMLNNIDPTSVLDAGLVIPDTRYENEVIALRNYANHIGAKFTLIYIDNKNAPPQGEELEKTVPLRDIADIIIDNSEQNLIHFRENIISQLLKLDKRT